MRANWGAIVATSTVVVLTACGDDAGSTPAPARDISSTISVEPDTGHDGSGAHEASGVRRWDNGSAMVDVDGGRWEFAVDLCAVQPVDADAYTNTVSLQVGGTASTGDGTVALAVVETVTHQRPSRIQVVSLRFEDADGKLLRTWEAQRVVDIESGEVDDMHGQGTTPLLAVDESDELVVTATDATFWQFGMGHDTDDGVIGTGGLRVRCTSH